MDAYEIESDLYDMVSTMEETPEDDQPSNEEETGN